MGLDTTLSTHHLPQLNLILTNLMFDMPTQIDEGITQSPST